MSSNPSSLTNKAYAGIFWQGLGFSLSTLLSVAHIVIMARLLSPEVFGQFAVASIIIALTTIFSEFGLGPALVQKANISADDISFVFLVNIVIGLFAFLLILFLAEPISLALKENISATMIQVLALNLVFKPIGLASHAVLLREMNFHKIFVATNLSYFLGMLAVGVALAWLGYGIWSLIIGFIATSAVISVYYLIKSPIKLSFNFNIKDSTHLFKYGLGLTSVQGLNQCSLMADKLLLNQLTSSTFLGFYERSQRIQQMPGVFICGVLDTVMFSALSKLNQHKNHLAKHFFNSIMIVGLIGSYLSVFVYTFADLIVNIMLGSQWDEAVSVLKLLAVLIGFQLVSRLCDTYVRSTSIFKQSIIVKITYLTTVILFAVIGYHFFNIQGVLLGIIAASGIHTLMMLFACQRHSEYPLAELAKRLMPCAILTVGLLIKNSWLIPLTAHSILIQIPSVLISDLVLIAILFGLPFLIGVDNQAYIKSRIVEFSALIKAKLKT